MQFRQDKYRRSELTESIKRNIKRKEKELGRTCRKIWGVLNPKGEKIIFASFCKNYDRLFISIAFFDTRMSTFRSI